MPQDHVIGIDISLDVLTFNLNIFLTNLQYQLPKLIKEELCNSIRSLLARSSSMNSLEAEYASQLKWLAILNEEAIKKAAELYHYYQEAVKSSHQENWKYSLGENQNNLLEKAHHLFVFINAVLFMHDDLDNKTENESISQHDLNLLLHLLASNGTQLDEFSPCYQFAFNFTDDELILTLKNILCDGEIIKLSNTKNSLLLRKINHQFSVNNPSTGEYFYSQNHHKLAGVIKKLLFKNIQNEELMTLIFDCYSRSNLRSKTNTTRVDAKNFILKLIELRKKNNISNLDVEGKDGMTMLEIFTRRNDAQIVSLLLEQGATPNIRNKSGWTPMHIAVFNGYKDVIINMLKKGDPNTSDSSKVTILHIAVNSKQREIAELILKHGADPNVVDNSSVSPLHLAAAHADASLINMLISYGANLLAEDKYGTTPLQVIYKKDKNLFDELFAKFVDKNKMEEVKTCLNLMGGISKIKKDEILLKVLLTLDVTSTRKNLIKRLSIELKSRIYTAVKNLSLQDTYVSKKEVLLACLQPNTLLGAIFYSRRGFFRPNLTTGYLSLFLKELEHCYPETVIPGKRNRHKL